MRGLVVGFALLVASCCAKAPVVLVPGLAGSVFRIKLTDAVAPHSWCQKTTSDYFVTWVNVEELLPLQKDCTLSRLKLYYNATQKTYHDAKGVSVDSNVDFGGVGGVQYLDPSIKASAYYADMIANLTAQGYVVGKDLHGAPYDWRLAPDGHAAPGAYYDKLRKLIETSVAANDNAGAHIVTHSLGGPTILGFLRRQTSDWLQHHVASFIPISAPWGGAARMALADVAGDNFDIPLVPMDYLKDVQDSAASGVFMLPTEAAFGSTTPIVTTPSANYSAAERRNMLQDLGLDQARDIYDHLGSAHDLLDDLADPRVPTHLICSKGVKTPERYHFPGDFKPGYDATPKSVDYGDGDGTVNLASLQYGATLWNETDTLWVTGVSHFGMTSHPEVLARVNAIVLDTN